MKPYTVFFKSMELQGSRHELQPTIFRAKNLSIVFK